MTIEELGAAIQTLVEETTKQEPLKCSQVDRRARSCLENVRHYGVPFDKKAEQLCPACEVCYHAMMARNALINYRRSR